MGRKLVYTDEQIEGALRDANGLIYLAARKLGCPPMTIYRRLKVEKNQHLRDLVNDKRGEIADICEGGLRKAALNNEPWAIALGLRTLRREIYGDKVNVENSGGIKITVEYVDG